MITKVNLKKLSNSYHNAHKNQNGNMFYDKLIHIYLEMLNFIKDEAELKTRIEQWLYFIKHLHDF